MTVNIDLQFKCFEREFLRLNHVIPLYKQIFINIICIKHLLILIWLSIFLNLSSFYRLICLNIYFLHLSIEISSIWIRHGGRRCVFIGSTEQLPEN